MDIVTIQVERASAEAELLQLQRDRAARQLAMNVADEARLADRAELDALHEEGNRDALHRLPALGITLLLLALGACCGAGGVLAWAYYLGRQ